MTTLRDMPMISVEQKNAFREAALKVEQERNALRKERDQMAALAEDRRQFIVSGAELGYISPPWDKDDPAYRVFQECNLEPSFAAASRDARMKAEALERAIKVMSQPMMDGGQPWIILVGDVRAMVAEYRKQAEGNGDE